MAADPKEDWKPGETLKFARQLSAAVNERLGLNVADEEVVLMVRFIEAWHAQEMDDDLNEYLVMSMFGMLPTAGKIRITENLESLSPPAH